jgi:NADP-dependent 3-hydroxy acid dehydrogenase YdfG
MSTNEEQGRVAVITGASSGIGDATARALAEELGDGALAIEADVTDRDSIVAAAERVHSDLGGADILVNNAGVMLLAPFSSEQEGRDPPDGRGQPARPMTATEVFLDHITDADAKQSAEQLYDEVAITADDIAEVIAFAVARPRRMTLNEILIRPTAQAL